MTTARSIPNYDLYGDQASPDWTPSFNFEWIPQRSAPYQWHIHPHRHEAFVQLLYLTKGEAQVRIDDWQVQAQAPCLVLVPAGHVHGFRFSTDIDGPVLTASQKTLESWVQAAMPQLLAMLRQPMVLSLPTNDEGQWMPLFLALAQEARQPDAGHAVAGMALLLHLLVQLHRRADQAQRLGQAAPLPLATRKSRQVQRFRALVDQHFRQHLGVHDYAHTLGVTAGHLSRLCKEVLGMSSIEVINAQLLREAERELLYTSVPIKQLATELGFMDDAYFSRFFRKHRGISPKAFRAESLARLSQGLAR